LAAFVLLVAGWITTLVEGVLWPTALNLAEHGFYALSGTCLAVWCWTALGSSRPRA
jgi:hypothetical protein